MIEIDKLFKIDEDEEVKQYETERRNNISLNPSINLESQSSDKGNSVLLLLECIMLKIYKPDRKSKSNSSINNLFYNPENKQNTHKLNQSESSV